MVRALLEAGASPSLSGQKGWTALMAAAAESHSEIADSLLQAGAEVNLSNAKGCTALIMAASNGSEGLYLLFLRLL